MFSLECLYSGLIIVFTKIFFRIKLPNFIYKLCIFIYSTSFVFPLLHKCRFWQDDRGFFPYQCFLFDWLPLFISPWQQILFYLPFLSISAFASYPPLLFTAMFSPSSALIFLPFWPFFLTRHQHCLKLFGGCNAFFCIFSNIGVFLFWPST